MKLYKAAKSTLIIILITFVVITLFQFIIPDVITRVGNTLYSFTTLILSLILQILWLLFYYAFRIEFITINQHKFYRTIQLLIYSYFALIAYMLISFMGMFSPMMGAGTWMIHIVVIIYWIQILLQHVLFLKIFSANLYEEYPSLKNALFLMIIGTFVYMILQTWILFDYYYQVFLSSSFDLFSQQIKDYIIFAISSFYNLITVYFLFSIYRRFKPVATN